ncbi:MAG TPA: PHB depolymerase family esterase [Casimicrobiaceae bacterium]|nr:PHB depolymerase family esterase [Casimicrobiaceae bacterium]
MNANHGWLAWITSRLRQLFRRAPAPGRWIEGGVFTFAGFVGVHPLAWPKRSYRLYLPQGFRKRDRKALIVFLHGCKQTSAEFAQGTRVTAFADANSALVLMPQQSESANRYGCWNWFDRRTVNGYGEAAIVAKMIEKIAKRFSVERESVAAGGISAGGSLAAILGLRYPDLIGNVFVHSGVACGASASPYAALSVMQRGPDTDVARIGIVARRSAEAEVRLLAIHGAMDDVVAPRHALALAKQYLAFNGIEVPSGGPSTLPNADVDTSDASTLPHTTRTREWRRGDVALVRLVEVEWLAHAWSGGDPALPFNNGAPPDAMRLVGDWLATSR